ncbi:MAG TPA: sigma-70 family RNA polymerase sigma factor [Planctomycetota bacterium]|nr:sigma-70 family RNA polymerase sigma factor [Planctomycetota bacterium]
MHALRLAPDSPPHQPPGTADLEAFVQQHQRGVWRFLRALGAPAHEADDVTQETFLLVLQKGPRAGEDGAPFLRQTAKYLWLRRRRDERRRVDKLAAAVELLWQDDCARDDGDGYLQALAQCLDTLQARARTVLQRFYGDGVGREELAAELSMTGHGVRTLLQRVRAALKDCIERRRKP